MNLPATFAQRVAILEVEAKTAKEFRADVETRLRRIEKLLYFLAALQLGLSGLRYVM